MRTFVCFMENHYLSAAQLPSSLFLFLSLYHSTKLYPSLHLSPEAL